MTNDEREFLRRLDVFRTNAHSCAKFAYMEMTIHRRAAEQPAKRDFLNNHADFWNTALAGMQAAAFIALGRIYENRRDTDNAAALLNYGSNRRAIFSREALATRKRHAGLSADEAANYAEGAHQLPAHGLDHLFRALEEKRQSYATLVKPVRDCVFAHTARPDHPRVTDPFAPIELTDFESLVAFPVLLHFVLQQLYHNGREPVLPDAPTAIDAILAEPLGRGTNTWEHVHATHAASDFLASMP